MQYFAAPVLGDISDAPSCETVAGTLPSESELVGLALLVAIFHLVLVEAGHSVGAVGALAAASDAVGLARPREKGTFGAIRAGICGFFFESAATPEDLDSTRHTGIAIDPAARVIRRQEICVRETGRSLKQRVGVRCWCWPRRPTDLRDGLEGVCWAWAQESECVDRGAKERRAVEEVKAHGELASSY